MVLPCGRLTVSAKPRVAVVVPTHNDWAHTEECLSYVAASTYSMDVYLVDDGSTDNTAEYATRSFGNVRILRGNGDLWWTGSMNLGIRVALECGVDYVLALNNDVKLAADAVAGLVDCAATHPEAVVGSIIYRADDPNRIWCAGGVVHWPWPGETMVGNDETDTGQYAGERHVDWTPGMGTLMSRQILLDI